MTSHFAEKSKWVIRSDTRVIVDNYVEIGDFSAFSTFFAKSFIFDLQLKNARIKFQKPKNTYLVNKERNRIDQKSSKAVKWLISGI